jgi:hypothetical protein
MVDLLAQAAFFARDAVLSVVEGGHRVHRENRRQETEACPRESGEQNMEYRNFN